MGTKTTIAVAGVAAFVGAAGALLFNPATGTDEHRITIEQLQARVADLEAPAAKRPIVGPRLLSDTSRAGTSVQDTARIEALEGAVTKLRTELATPESDVPETQETTDKDAPPSKPKDFASLESDALFVVIRSMAASKQPDGAEIVRAADELLSRDITDETRAQGLIRKGIGHRVLRDEATERRTFEEAIDVAGRDSEGGYQALWQLAWTDARGGNNNGAAQRFVDLVEHPAATTQQAAWNLLQSAHLLVDQDPEGARRRYQRVIDEYGDSKDGSTRAAVNIAKKALERLKK